MKMKTLATAFLQRKKTLARDKGKAFKLMPGLMFTYRDLHTNAITPTLQLHHQRERVCLPWYKNAIFQRQLTPPVLKTSPIFSLVLAVTL